MSRLRKQESNTNVPFLTNTSGAVCRSPLICLSVSVAAWMMVLFINGAAVAGQVSDDPVQFALNNPDGSKYDFVRTYITALEYLYQNEQAKAQVAAFSEENLKRAKYLAQERERLKKANLNLRVARNLLQNFRNPNNNLMRKVVELFSEYVEQETNLNNQHRGMVMILHEAALDNRVTSVKKKWYTDQLLQLNERRKESSPALLEASMLIGKVLISHEFNRMGDFYKLGIDGEERERLRRRLDTFSDEQFRGEIRAGQTYLQASIASIREVLDDPQWPSR